MDTKPSMKDVNAKIQRYLQLYRLGRCSLDKAAQEIGITLSEMMDEAKKEHLGSQETIHEYRQGLEILESD